MSDAGGDGQNASRFPGWKDPGALIDLSGRLVRTWPWTNLAAVSRELREWVLLQGPGWPDLEGRESDVADDLGVLGRLPAPPDPDMAARITYYMLVNVAHGRGASEYDLLGTTVRGYPERSLRRYRDPSRARLDAKARRLALLDWPLTDIAAAISNDRHLGTADRLVTPDGVKAILAADPWDPFEPFHRFMVSFQRRLDVALLVRAGWRPQTARQWLRRHPGSHANDAPPAHEPT